MSDPKDVRTLHGRDGVVTIPRAQQGVAFEDYFRNVKLPEDPTRMVVYVTEQGPILGDPDPVPWSEQHDRIQTDAVERLKGFIDEHGKYSARLNHSATRLARETGLAVDEAKTRIIGEFAATYGKEPYHYLDDLRAAQGLSNRQEQRATQDQGIEMDG